jgi:Fe-S oxidoreductase
MANIEAIDEVQPKRIVTTCPHCLQALGQEYGQFGANYTVIHHSQLLSELIAAQRIMVTPSDSPDGSTDTITFHDPCYLARNNGITEAPRNVLGATAPVIEMPRHGKSSFCCGAGGAQMWKEEEPGTEPVNDARYAEAAATGVKTVAVGCPFCLTMLNDAAKRVDAGITVKDIAELVAERLS